MWQFSKINELEKKKADLQEEIQRLHLLTDCLVGYLDSITGFKHATLGDQLYILRSDGVFMYRKTLEPPAGISEVVDAP